RRQRAAASRAAGDAGDRPVDPGAHLPRPAAHRTTRYCTLKSWCGSIQTCATVKPAAAASRANAGGAYLYELSVQMLSPRQNENALSLTRTVCAQQLTRCISTRCATGL